MRGSLLDFTRGSQVAETIGMMFGTALRPMLWTLTVLIAVSTGYQVWHHFQKGDDYYWMMHGYAAAWHYFEFNSQHLVGLKMVSGDTARVPIGRINTYPPLIDAWSRMTSAITAGALGGLALGLPVAIVTTIVLRRFGHDLTERKHARGATLAPIEVLLQQVLALNQLAQIPERTKLARQRLGRWHHAKTLLPAVRANLEAELHVPYTIGDIPYPWRAEQSHTMIVGTTGTGKSTAIKNILRQIKARGDRAVVFDLTGTFIEGFYNPETDIILNPFDLRCPTWSPFADAHTREHFKEVSQALVPVSDGGGDNFWPETARMLFVETCVRLVEQGRGNNKALADVLMTSKLKDLHAHVAKTIAAPLTDPEAKRMAESIRATFNTYAQALLTLPDSGPVFSVRDWVMGIDQSRDVDTGEGIDVLAALRAEPATTTATAQNKGAEKERLVAGPVPVVTYDALTGEIVADEEQPGTATAAPVTYDTSTGEIIEDGKSAVTDGATKANEPATTASASEAETADKPTAIPPVTPAGSILFVAAQHVNLHSVRVLLTMWITTAINTLMSMRGDQRDIRLWFLIDEIGALHNIPAIVAGMQTSRNYGGAFVLGVHTMAQLRKTYGDNDAETISSLAKTKLLMSTRDRGTQDWESEQIGDSEWSEMEENWSYGVDNVRDAATLQKKIKLEPLVLPTEFAELPDLHGYLKFPQGLPAARIALTYAKYKRQTAAYIERIIPPLAMPLLTDEEVAPASTPPLSSKTPPATPVVTVKIATAGLTAATAKSTKPAPSTAPATIPPATNPSSNPAAEDDPPPAQPNDGGEGFQTAVSTAEPPERVPSPAQKALASLADIVPDTARIAGTPLDPRWSGNPAGDGSATTSQTATTPVSREAREPGEPPQIPGRVRETTQVALVAQELRMNFQTRHPNPHLHQFGPISPRAFKAADIRLRGPEDLAADATRSERAAMAARDHGIDDDDGYSR